MKNTIEAGSNQRQVAEEILRGTPRPHYLFGEIHVDENGLGLRAKVKFPTTELSIADRGHVNIAHYLFAVWNASHILRLGQGFKEALSTGGTWRTPKFAAPDIPMDLRVQVIAIETKRRIATGLIEATFSIGEDTYAMFTSEFFAQR